MTALLDQFGIGDARAREEAWRYSRNALRALEQQAFAPADSSAPLSAELAGRFAWPETEKRRVVFVNGGFSERHSRFEPDASVSMTNDAQRTTLRLSGDTTRTLHLVFANVPGAAPIQWRRELTIEVEGSDAELIEHHLGEIGADVLGALTSTIRLVEGAELRTVAISDLADSVSLYRRDEVRLAAGAKHCATHALFGGRLQRWDLLTEIGAQAAYVSRGVFALRSRQHVDVHLDACHAARDARSDVAWRGVADQRARGILHGAITVAEGADGADAQLQTKNLLLSPHAEIDAQPVLEIYADEVKATHGATVGQLDERALFYLRSRGIAAADARALLIAGFCRETLADLPDAHLRERIDAILSLHLPQG